MGNVAALSLGTNFLTEASLPHLIMMGVKNLTAVALEAEYYEFAAVKKVKDFLDNPDAFVCAAAAAPAAGGAASAAPAAAAKEPEPEPEEEEEDMGFDLFD